jgi:broad specificity phosphatase PhoE
MSYLILIRHSISKPQADQSAHQWQLTEEGQARCKKLAEQIRAYQPTRFYSSDEPKAIDTTRILMKTLNIAPEKLQTEVCFRETSRENVPFVARLEDFQNAIREAMQKPDEIIYGEESFNQALTRFSQRIQLIINAHPTETTTITSHGTILSLYIASQTGQDVFSLWQSLDMPAYAVFELPEMRLAQLVTTL